MIKGVAENAHILAVRRGRQTLGVPQWRRTDQANLVPRLPPALRRRTDNAEDTQAKEVLALIDRFGRQEAVALRSAVHERDDAAAQPYVGLAAKRRLTRFVRQLAGTIREVGPDFLEKYLEPPDRVTAETLP